MPFNHGLAHLTVKENTQVLTLEVVCMRGGGVCVGESGSMLGAGWDLSR